MKAFIHTLALLSALVTICASHDSHAPHGTQTQVIPGTYADTVLRGLKRLAERARAQGIINVVTESECNLVCPISTVCSLQFIVPRCVPVYRRFPVMESLYESLYRHPTIHGEAGFRGALKMHGNLNVPLATGDASYIQPTVTVAKGQATLKGGLTIAGKAKVPVLAVDTGNDESTSSFGNEQTSVKGDSLFTHLTGSIPDVPAVPGALHTQYNDEPAIPSTGSTTDLQYKTRHLGSTTSFSDIIKALALAGVVNGYQQPTVGRTSKSIMVDLGLGLNNCGYMPPECRAIHNELSTASKYSFDYTSHRCVRVDVCSTCSLLSGARFNLFDSQFDCDRFCQ